MVALRTRNSRQSQVYSGDRLDGEEGGVDGSITLDDFFGKLLITMSQRQTNLGRVPRPVGDLE